MPEFCEGNLERYYIYIISFNYHSIVLLFIITVLNAFLLRKMQVQNTFRARSEGQHCALTSFVKNVSLDAMMVSLCVVFAVTSLPRTILIIVN